MVVLIHGRHTGVGLCIVAGRYWGHSIDIQSYADKGKVITLVILRAHP